MAASSSSSSTIAALTSALHAALADAPSLEQLAQAPRMQLLAALDALRVAAEPPLVSLQRLTATHATLPAVRVAQGMGVFDVFAAAPAGAELDVDAISAGTKGDRLLLARLLRVLAAENILREPRPQVYTARPVAAMLASTSPTGPLIAHRYETLLVGARLYEHLAATGFANPGDARAGPFQHAYGTDLHYFDWLAAHPPNQAAFNATMAMAGAYRGEAWHAYFPAAAKLAPRPGQSVALVDVGGGAGHDVRALRDGVPELKGARLVLQDLPHVVDAVDPPLAEGDVAMAHDMFKEQPLVNARAYYLRTVLHDWPDLQAREVLLRTREAMGEESILLLNENVLPEEGAAPFVAKLDFAMMEIFASLERTEKQWRELLESAGLRVVGVYRPKGPSITSNAVFEAVKA